MMRIEHRTSDLQCELMILQEGCPLADEKFVVSLFGDAVFATIHYATKISTQISMASGEEAYHCDQEYNQNSKQGN